MTNSAALLSRERCWRRPPYPFWALVLVAIDVLVIYGLVAYGGRLELTR